MSVVFKFGYLKSMAETAYIAYNWLVRALIFQTRFLLLLLPKMKLARSSRHGMCWICRLRTTADHLLCSVARNFAKPMVFGPVRCPKCARSYQGSIGGIYLYQSWPDVPLGLKGVQCGRQGKVKEIICSVWNEVSGCAALYLRFRTK